MKYKLLNALSAAILFLMPVVSFGQVINLGTAANFVLFTTNGAMSNAGIPHLTHLTGNVGSNLAGSISGFGNVDGQMHAFDAVTIQAVVDVNSVYSQLNAVTPTAVHPVLLGGGETLTPGVYHILANSTLNTTLTLDALGNANAVFIFQIDGTFSTTTLSKVKMVNGGLACNVFWKIEGVVSMASGTTLVGTIVAHNAAINMSALDTLEGRALSINGAVGINAILAYKPIGCGSAVLTGPAAPALVAAAQFGVFSSIGAVTSTPITYVIGDVGSNSTTTTGFNPLFVTGVIHTPPDAATAAAAGSLTNAYNYLVALPVDIELTDPANFGFDLVLTPHTYHLGAVTMLNGNVILNAQGNPNAVFVIQINGAFNTTSLSKIILRNGTQAKNVYWKIDGAVHIFPNSLFNGTIVAAGAITLDTGDTLNGRALTIGGAVAINGSYVTNVPSGCAAAPITGSHSVCTGSTTRLSDADAGGTWASSNTTIATVGSSSGIVTGGALPGAFTITYTSPLACTATFTMAVTPGAAPITGPNGVCIGSTIALSNATAGGTWSSSNTSLATVGTASGIVTGVASGIPSLTYTIAGGCVATKTVTVNTPVSAGTITGPSGVCVGSTIALSDAVPGGTWSSSNTRATVSPSGVVTGVATGIDTIRYRVTSACGADTARKIITVNTSSNAGTITGPSSVCTGSSIALSNAVTGGTWTASNTTATVSNSGVVTGVAAGVNTITYTVNNGCGLATTTKTVTVNASPNAGTISGPSSVCVGSSIVLSENVPAGIWTSSNTTATVLAGVVTGIVNGTDTIMYTVTNGTCTAAATKIITVIPSAGAGSISGPSGVCDGFSITLSDGVPGGVWSSSNTTATVSPGGVVTGNTPGVAMISYTVTNGCGTAVATKTITVTPLPDAGTITGPSSVCEGSSIALTDNMPGGVWSSSNTNATVSGSGVVTGNTAGLDVIRYEVTNACGTIIATKAITINAGPNAGTITGPSSVCTGSVINLTDNIAGGTWSSSNTNATVSNGTVTGNTAGTGIINYTVNNGCGVAVATKTITVNPLPNAGTITGASSVCVGSIITLSNNTPGGAWSATNTSATVLGGIVTGNTPGTDTIRYAVTNACGTTTATKTIMVVTPPNAGTITGPSNLCTGVTITLNNTAPGGVWSSSNTATTVAGGIVSGITPGTSTISYTVTNACGTAVATKAITVNAHPLAAVISTQSPAAVCTGLMYQNFGAATLPPTGTNYNWTVTNGTLWAQGTGHQYALVNFNMPGTATVSLNATNTTTGCSSKSTVIVTVGPGVSETPVVTYFSNDHFVCTPNTENSYQWGYDDAYTLDSTILTGEINQDYLNTSPDFTGKRYWVMTSAGGCTQKTYYNTPTIIQNVNAAATISVYPNPATDLLNVTISNATSDNIQVDVWNIMGQKVAATQTKDNKATININTLPAGSYVVTCYSNGTRIGGATFIKN